MLAENSLVFNAVSTFRKHLRCRKWAKMYTRSASTPATSSVAPETELVAADSHTPRTPYNSTGIAYADITKKHLKNSREHTTRDYACISERQLSGMQAPGMFAVEVNEL